MLRAVAADSMIVFLTFVGDREHACVVPERADSFLETNECNLRTQQRVSG